jgi:hypothetical protein
MGYILLTLVSEILLISFGRIMCFVMPEYYTPKNRKAILSVGIFLVIAYIILMILNAYVCFKYGHAYPISDNLRMQMNMCCIAHIILRIAICCYLLFASTKLHSILLNSVIVISGALKVMLMIINRFRDVVNLYSLGLECWEVIFHESYSGPWYRGVRLAYQHRLSGFSWLYLGISFLTVVITVILLIYMKYNGDYTAPDEIQEYEPLKYCPQCGKPVGAEENFCTNCGAKVE